MTPTILWEFAKSFCVLFFITFVFSKLNIVRNHLSAQPERMREKLVLALLFGGLGCVGSGIGIEFHNSLINTRVIGVAVGGLIGGPLVGILSGAIAGLHRILFVKAGTATALVCGVSMMIEGAFAGALSRYSPRFKKLWPLATLTVIACELFRKLMLLLFIRPFDFAVLLVKNMTVPMLIINSLGVALFITFIESVEEEREQVKARQSELVLSMTEKISSCFRQGLIPENLTGVIRTVEENTDFSHVLIADRGRPIACNRPDDDPPVAAVPWKNLPEIFRQGASYHVFEREGVHWTCVPLYDETEVAGYFLLGKRGEPNAYDCGLAEGLGKLFSAQLTRGNLEYRSNLLKEAEIKVLQTQISPHFLFNSLTVISSLCRSDPQKARNVIDKLAEFYRKNLRINARFVSLQDEIEHIEAYLEIIQARYASKIRIQYDIDRALHCYLPPLSLQPLVENSIKHGLLPKREGGVISIRAKHETGKNAVKIEVEDNGMGFAADAPQSRDSNRVGLDNVRKRLRNCFGDDLTWRVDSRPEEGTKVTIVIPEFSNG